ncbi:hypothetical protein [Mesorhizobium sp. SP-1A]|uniref:hypothetical protein n=1 Tax=Mesorhizobium sp. SP-1A TaxID=3077840 RepID=UPI0028F72F0F|nr:hypothetical protein [Mesorhizobium sp. SP-1A]
MPLQFRRKRPVTDIPDISLIQNAKRKNVKRAPAAGRSSIAKIQQERPSGHLHTYSKFATDYPRIAISIASSWLFRTSKRLAWHQYRYAA